MRLTFIRLLLPDQLLLRSILDRHVASIDDKARSVSFSRDVVVWRAAVPEKQVTWFSAHLDPFATVVF